MQNIAAIMNLQKLNLPHGKPQGNKPSDKAFEDLLTELMQGLLAGAIQPEQASSNTQLDFSGEQTEQQIAGGSSPLLTESTFTAFAEQLLESTTAPATPPNFTSVAEHVSTPSLIPLSKQVPAGSPQVQKTEATLAKSLGISGQVPQGTNTLAHRYAAQLDAVKDEVTAAAQATGVDPKILEAFMIQESGAEQFAGGRVKQEPYGGIGIMQITANNAGGYDLKDPRQNILRGAQIIQGYLKQYGGNLGLTAIAYNSGPGALAAAFRTVTGKSIGSVSPEQLKNFDPLSLNSALFQGALSRGSNQRVAAVKRDYAEKLLQKFDGLGGSAPGVSTYQTQTQNQTVIGTLTLPLTPSVLASGQLDFGRFDLAQSLKPVLDNVFNQVTYEQNDKVKSFAVKLLPEHLGSMDIKVSLENGQVNTHILVSNSQVADFLNKQLGQLRHDLLDQGLALGQLDVSLQQGFAQGQSHRPFIPTTQNFSGVTDDEAEPPDYGYQDNSGQAIDLLA